MLNAARKWVKKCADNEFENVEFRDINIKPIK